MDNRHGIFALSPLLVFVTLYLLTSLAAGDFYRMPITVAFLAASVYAVCTGRGPLRKRIDTFSRGAGNSQMMLMVWIFVLSGAFANSAKTMGSVDATVQLTMSLLPPHMLLSGLFLAACFVSLSIGTSVGTIVALTPIAAGVAQQTGADVATVTAAVVGGSFFGDNLSFISDTTIIATQTQGCRLSDKFRVNSFIVIPPAIAILFIYVILGSGMSAPAVDGDADLWLALPYFAVLATAVAGINVMAVLMTGIALCGGVGLATGAFADVFAWMQAMGNGITDMGELIIITMLAGGLLEMVKERGGIDFVVSFMTRRLKGKRGAEMAIGALVAAVDVCTANNTVAIITVGDITRQIGTRFHLDPRKCASLLDTFSCATQGMLPYGAQILIAAGLAETSPISIVPHLYYPMAIGVAAVLAIVARYPGRYT